MDEEEKETQVKLEATGFLNEAGRFEVDAITAGEGNGWTFSAEVLKESLALWEGANCFIDHSYWGGRSIHDLAGIFHNPKWNEATNGVRLELQTMGPCGPLVDELGPPDPQRDAQTQNRFFRRCHLYGGQKRGQEDPSCDRIGPRLQPGPRRRLRPGIKFPNLRRCKHGRNKPGG